MDTLDYIEISSKNVDDCITEACEHFSVTSDRLEYEVIQQGSTGFLGLAVKPAVIRAWIKGEKSSESVTEEITELPAAAEEEEDVSEAPMIAASVLSGLSDKKPVEKKYEEDGKSEDRRQEEKPQRRSIKGTAKLDIVNDEYPEDSYIQNEATETAEKFLKDVFAAMGMEVQISARFQPNDRILEVDMEGSDMGVLIGKRGQTLDSLQYLVSLVVNKGNDSYIHVKLDTENYRERRKKTLENLAKNIAYKVRKTRQSVSLEPMNPYERRIIHSSLQSDRYVTTHSEGEEPYRYVVISMKR